MQTEDLKTRLLAAILPHVTFDGWSEAALRAACADLGVSLRDARTVCPRGALDLAVAQHEAGDALMLERLRKAELGTMRMRERIAHAVILRLEVANDREAVRRASALFALPQHAAEGARLLWRTADLIWTALGDQTRDLNWYTKRATLAGVLGAAVLYWLGDTSDDMQDTRAFVAREIEGVMAIESMKDKMRRNPATRGIMQMKDWMAARVSAPTRVDDLPGRFRP